MNEQLEAYFRRRQLQEEFCRKNGYPVFNSTGVCWRCHSNVYDYYDDEYCATTLITGCPVCHKTFCD